jgi:RNA polymerase sigma-70 factor (ECF subfamily)
VEQKRLEFTEFYPAARDECLRIVMVSVGDRQLAEDLVAEAFTRAWTSWRTVREHPAPRAWVVRTALNTHVSWWRRRRREVWLEGHDVPAPAAREPAVDERLVAAVRRLPARQREVITLRVFFDLDTETKPVPYIALTLTPSAMPRGTELLLSIVRVSSHPGLDGLGISMVRDGAPLTCTSTPPAPPAGQVHS